jgi:glycosyltransferase involved in cell wall biosynthesis
MNFELLILNDGSTDHTEDEVKRFDDNRIRYVRFESNQGLVHTLNEGIKKSYGEFIARMDADDVALPDRLFRQVEFLLRHPDHVLCASSYVVMNKFGRLRHAVSLPETDPGIRTLLFFGNCICHSSVMFRKKALNGEGYQASFLWCEDYELWTRLSAWHKMAIIPEPLVRYRLHGSNVSVKNRKEMLINVSRISANHLERMGIAYGREDFLLHHAFLSYNVEYIKKVGFTQLQRWLVRIQYAFLRCRNGDGQLAEKVMIRRWVTLCFKAGAYGNLFVNSFVRNDTRFYLNCVLGKIRDRLFGRMNAYDF